MNSTFIVGIGSLILTGVFYYQLRSLPSVAQRLPGLLVWIVAGLALLMIVEEVLKQRRLRNASQDAPAIEPAQRHGHEHGQDGVAAAAVPEMDDDDTPPEPINWKVIISFSVALVAYVALIDTVGYVITTVIFMAGVLFFSRTIRPLTAVLVSLGLTAFVWLVFVWALGLPVPLLPWLS